MWRTEEKNKNEAAKAESTVMYAEKCVDLYESEDFVA
jgi:hypothetical protein